jgi:hypothetical protein
MAVGVIALIASLLVATTYRPEVATETLTRTGTLTTVSTLTVPTTATATVVSVETQTEYLVPSANASLTLTPSVASGGTVMHLTGGGLPANTQLSLDDCLTGVPYTYFTTDSSGSVPPNVTFDVLPLANPGPETGAPITLQIDGGSGCGHPLGVVAFLYEATMTLDAVGVLPGATLTASASGLVSGGLYEIVFNYSSVSTNPDAYNGTVVGAMIANALGQGSSAVTVPSWTTPGTYNVGLVSTHDIDAMVPAGASALNAIPTCIVYGSCLGQNQTSCVS